ncbi:VOC family protein [Planosporangium thailandense]|uniref:VOC family protein n=1 Tax=Planosporangium thailandense TaxID=765197 RepID=UPI0030B827E2
MSSAIASITVDCARPHELARFWSEVVGWPIDPDVKPDADEAWLRAPDGHPILLFIRVPEGKAVKNRLHLDLRPQDRTRDGEVERLLALGARQVDDRRTSDGKGWVVLTDPEGNEFCVERSAAERADD